MKSRLFFLLSILWISIGYSQTENVNNQDDFSVLANKITVIENKLSTIESENDQIQALEKNLKTLKYQMRRKDKLLSNNISEFQEKSKYQIDSLKNIISLNAKSVAGTTQELDIKIESAENSADTAITGLYKSHNHLLIYLLFAFLILIAFIVLVFVILSKKINRQVKYVNESLQKSKEDVDRNIANTQDLMMLEIKANKKAFDNDLKNAKIGLETNFKKVNNEQEAKSKVAHEALSENIETISKSMADSIEKLKKTLAKDLLEVKKAFKEENTKVVNQMKEWNEAQLNLIENNKKD